MSNARELLGPSGPLARALRGYEVREGQLMMAEAVERSLAQEHLLICEAGTGTGKTLAYLVAALLSGKRVVVSTATRALQEQIFNNDLPLIRGALGLDGDAALMKGLGNYLCRRRWQEFTSQSQGIDARLQPRVASMRRWLATTTTGDFAELDDFGENDAVLPEVGSSTDTRVGQGCRHFSDCFVTQMRRRAEQARLIVVNHHLFFADLALRGPHPGRVIPDYDAVILDEAHQIEDVATGFFGLRVTSQSIERAIREARRQLESATAGDPWSHRVADHGTEGVRRALDALHRRLEGVGRTTAGRITLEHDFWTGAAQAAYHALDGALELVELDTKTTAGKLVGAPRAHDGRTIEALEMASRRMRQLRDKLARIVEGAPSYVSWLELGQRGFTLSASPVDLSVTLRELLFESVPTVVLTSATLATSAQSPTEPPSIGSADAAKSHRFSYLRDRLGLTDTECEVRELVVPSPFDFERRALLYAPRDLPPPGATDHLPQTISRCAELIGLSDGGAFVLTTSLRAMHAHARALRESDPEREVLCQGEQPKSRLLDRFRASRRSVLVATLGFWEGVDVPGEALRLVVLDKIPFSVPTDPIVAARARAGEAEGKNPFMHLFVPAAAISLKQGFGRLIRTRQDFGVVALLDSRVRSKSYGRKLLDALPRSARTAELDDVAEFFRRFRAG